MCVDVKVPLQNGNEITLTCSGETLYEWQIREGWLKENPVIYWSDTEFYHWFFDFVIARKDGWDIWCESVEINNELNKFWVHFYRR